MHQTLFLAVLAVVSLAAAEKKFNMIDLPPGVYKSVQEQIKGATVKGVSKEVEGGNTLYEIETSVNGKGRDLTFDASGTLLEVEEEVALESLPAAVRAAVEKEAAGGKISKVETVTKGTLISYEADIKKDGKHSEVKVNADGTLAK